MACFIASAASSVAFSVPQNRLAPLGDGLEGLGERHLLERAGPEDLGLHLPGQGEHRRAVDLGVPQAGQQVGGAGPGDREARRRAARSAWRRRWRRTRRRPRGGCRRSSAGRPPRPCGGRRPARGWSGRPSRTPCRGPSRRASSTTWSISDTAARRHGQLDVEAVGALLARGRRGAHRGSPAAAAGAGVVLVAVPRADDEAVLELAVAERPALVRAAVVEHAVALRRCASTQSARPAGRPPSIDAGRSGLQAVPRRHSDR